MFKTKTINDIEIKPIIKGGSHDKKTIRAYDWYPEPYANICMLARKKSGKTNAIYRALEKCATKGTNVFIFSPTVHIDDTYKKMISMLKKKKCTVVAKEHFVENGVDLVEQLLSIFGKTDTEDQKKEDEYVAPPLLLFGDTQNYKMVNKQIGGECTLVRKPKREPKKTAKKGKGKADKMITPEHILIFDDLSSDMKCKTISRLLTKNRHYKLKVFIAVHSVNNLEKMGLSCVDYFHVFPNVSAEKIDELKEKVNITFKNDSKKDSKLQKLYDYATAKPYNFLYIDRVDGCFRKNYNEKIIVDTE